MTLPRIGDAALEGKSRTGDLRRIEDALEQADRVLAPYLEIDFEVEWKGADDPVTAADREVDTLLREALYREGDAWLSEETVDDHARLDQPRVWIVDPLDGTKEFVKRIPEWCVSIGLVEDERPVAGGILNPVTREVIVGSLETGVFLNGEKAPGLACEDIAKATVLASRSEMGRGQWAPFEPYAFTIRPVGSVAYKMALVAAGQVDATWSFVPKNEWDIAAGAALVAAAGGHVCSVANRPLRFNQPKTLRKGVVSLSASTTGRFLEILEPHWMDED